MNDRSAPRPSSEIEVFYIGSIVPDPSQFVNIAFSRAANSWQINLLHSIIDGGISVSRIVSQRPFCSFPRFKTLWCGGQLTAVTPRLRVQQLQFLNVTGLRTLWTGIGIIFEALRWRWGIANGATRILVMYNLTEPNGIFLYIAGKLTGSRIVASINDVLVPGVLVGTSVLRRCDYWLQKKLIPRLDGAIVVSASIRDNLCAGVPTLQIEGGIPEDLLDWQPNSQREKESPDQRHFRILLSGSLTEANGVLEVLEAVASCGLDQVQLFVAGRGPLTKNVQDAARLDPRIIYLGFLDRVKLLECYKQMDLLLNFRLTLRLKTDYFFPSKLLEFLATGLPVLTTKVGGFLQQFEGEVFLLDEETPVALAAKLRQIVEQPIESRLAIGRAAKARAINSLSWTEQGLKVAAFLKNIGIAK
jgi:glycosyltransferase involved in cell wall biosynthesis